jgi:hypothetical protein
LDSASVPELRSVIFEVMIALTYRFALRLELSLIGIILQESSVLKLVTCS